MLGFGCKRETRQACLEVHTCLLGAGEVRESSCLPDRKVELVRYCCQCLLE